MGILLPNCTHYVLGLLGAMEAGLTVTTLNPAYTMPEIARQLEMSDAKVILTGTNWLPAVKEALTKIGKLGFVYVQKLAARWRICFLNIL